MRGEEIYAVLIFIMGGFLAYLVYELVRALRPAKFGVVSHITDAIFAILAAVLFVAISHFLFLGKIKYFTLLCFVCGGVAARLTIRQPIRKFVFFIKHLYKSSQQTNTNDTIKEEIMANQKNNQNNQTQNNQQGNQQNKQQNKQQGTERAQKSKSTRTTKG
ncbi:MAG: hypothetical protein WC292_04215 [Clostridia bacterium]